MPKQRIVTVYSFEELSEEAQEIAKDKFRFANVDHGWWDSVYEMAEEIGISITGFDIDAGIIKGKLNLYFSDSFKLIRKNWGRSSEIYKTAKSYVKKFIKEFKEWKGNNDWTVDEFFSEDGAEELHDEYKMDMLEEFLIILNKEYEYQTSDEQVKEFIISNEYEFLENGKLA